MAAENINLADGRFFNLNGPIQRAIIVGASQEYANISAVPDALRYSGKYIYNEDTDTMYLIKADLSTEVVKNTEVSFSEDGTEWKTIDELTTDFPFKYLRFSNDGGVTWSQYIRVLTPAEITAVNAHANASGNPHEATAAHIPLTDDPGSNSILDEIDIINSELDDKQGYSGGQPGEFPLVDDDGFLNSENSPLNYTEVLEQLNAMKHFYFQKSATTKVETVAVGDELSVGVGGDLELYLKNYDKYHLVLQGDMTMLGFSDDNNIKAGFLFTLIFTRTIAGTSTVSFADTPWGSSFEDITVNQNQKVMVTGYVYSRDIYLAKKVNFD